ncbi:hypothetical protein PoMZ_07835 [Pyricularia oryzae]|uniref:Uncharacterized protein n=1 Tax=Pyricularia oryzae TaxID=318829 RepID=A0A4P7NG41_PYROR|nr:hypothetical protein PoMZ_07835 [Pyricularia oryzae]
MAAVSSPGVKSAPLTTLNTISGGTGTRPESTAKGPTAALMLPQLLDVVHICARHGGWANNARLRKAGDATAHSVQLSTVSRVRTAYGAYEYRSPCFFVFREVLLVENDGSRRAASVIRSRDAVLRSASHLW